jgi:hypothetical protein
MTTLFGWDFAANASTSRLVAALTGQPWACPGHPRLSIPLSLTAAKEDVDARHKAGHDDGADLVSQRRGMPEQPSAWPEGGVTPLRRVTPPSAAA